MTKVEKFEVNRNSTGKRGEGGKNSPLTIGTSNSCISLEIMNKFGPKKTGETKSKNELFGALGDLSTYFFSPSSFKSSTHGTNCT